MIKLSLRVAAVLMLVGLADATDDRFAGKLEPCEISPEKDSAYCGYFSVPELSKDPESREIELWVTVVPSRSISPSSDALVFLPGGGVLPASRYAPFFARRFESVRAQRDILLVDQRGTGRSHPLVCPGANPDTATRDDDYVRLIRQCRDELSDEADLLAYSTFRAMDDLDAVRRWLGYEQLTLYGASYGTKAARVFARQHPDAVRAIILHGVVPIENTMWDEHVVHAQASLDDLIAECQSDPDCNGRFPQFGNQIEALFDGLRIGALALELTDARTDETFDVRMDPAELSGALYRLMYQERGRRELPLLVEEATADDWSHWAPLLAPGSSEVPTGLYFSIACPEEVNRLEVSPESLPETRYFTSDWLERQLLTCREWPARAYDDSMWRPLETEVPVLILAGAHDHVTPPVYGARVASHLQNVRLLVLPNRGHNDLDPCLGDLIQEFIERVDLRDLDTSCLSPGPVPAFLLSRE